MYTERPKTLFFRLYLGQQFVDTGDDCPADFETPLTLDAVNIDGVIFCNEYDAHCFNIFDCFLMLQSFNDITPEHLQLVAQVFVNNEGFNETVLRAVLDMENGEITYYCGDGTQGYSTIDFDHLPKACTDIILELGYLIPFSFLDEYQHPVTLQPDDIIKLNWASYPPPETLINEKKA